MPPTSPTAPAPPNPAPPPASASSGILGRYLTHPGAETAHLVHHLAHVLAAAGTHLGPPIVAGMLLVAAVVIVIRHRAAVAMGRGARQVEVLAPPEVDPDGAAVLWSNLVALLRPAWRRAVGAQPHLGLEITAGAGGLAVRFWVPACVPPGLVEGAVEAA